MHFVPPRRLVRDPHVLTHSPAVIHINHLRPVAQTAEGTLQWLDSDPRPSEIASVIVSRNVSDDLDCVSTVILLCAGVALRHVEALDGDGTCGVGALKGGELNVVGDYASVYIGHAHARDRGMGDRQGGE